MPLDIIPEHFVAGRDAYVANVPLLEILDKVDTLGEQGGGDAVASFAAGFFDGVLADIRLAAKNAREEIDQRA